MSLKSLVYDLKKDGRKDKEASRAAAKKLGEIGDESVLKDLERAASNHKDKETRELAKTSIKSIKNAINKSNDPTPSSADSYEITEAKEVSTPSEDALLLIVEETQKGTINRDGTPFVDEDEKIQLDATGVLKVKNTGEEDRIWDIDIKIKEKGLTKLKDIYHINELDHQEEQEFAYDIEDLPDSLPLKFSETIDTVGGEEPSAIMVFGKTMETKITYEISAEKNLVDIQLEKSLPPHFSGINIGSSSIGKANINGDKLTWEIESLNENESGTLQLTCEVKAEDTEPKRTGESTLKYSSKVEGAFSGMDVEGADGLVKNYSYVESDELEDQPDNWNCKLVLENPSEFPIELRDILIKKGEYVFISEEYEAEDGVIIPSKGTWNSKEFTLFSEDIPSFEKNVTFTVKPEIMYRASSILNVIDTEMKVANLRASKNYGVEMIKSYRKTPIPTTIEFSNIGSLSFSSVTVKDVIPPKFSPSEPENVVITIGKRKLKVADYEVSYESGANVTVPSESESELPPKDTEQFDDGEFGEQTMIIKINKEIKPDQKVKIEFTPTAENPQPNRNFSGNAEIIADLAEPGPPLNVFVTDWLSGMAIKVVHERKAITIGKQIIPGAEPGLFEIELSFKNRGDTALENIAIKDIIPEGFNLVNDAFDDLAESESAPQGTIRTWTFETIEKDQAITITYNLQGQGDKFHISQAQQTIG